jgi:uroporphyrinogen decarboxylase
VCARYRWPDPELSPSSTWKSPFEVERTGLGYGQPLSHPLKDAKTVRDVLDYPWPDPRWMDVSEIRADALRWGGEFAVLGGDWSPFSHDAIDSQSVLIEENPGLVRRETRRVLDIMSPGGGYVAGASHDYILEETPLDNVLAKIDAIREYGRK